jgi:hypothetical protein
MIKQLEIKNFKSVKHLRLKCKRVNLFIGEPNTGKSNILEALGFLSHIYYGGLGDFVRFETMIDLFYDRSLEEDNNVNITIDGKTLEVSFKDGRFYGDYSYLKESHPIKSRIFDYEYGGSGSRSRHKDFSRFKFYRFAPMRDFPNKSSEFLLPPRGLNLLAVILARKELRYILMQIFNKFGFEIALRPHEGRIDIQKRLEENIVISLPYYTASDTLQRIVFYLTAIYSNKQSILAFEEPEAHAFPYYTKYLAERIALDKNENQYFISTHNPYFLLSILEKTPKDEIAVFITNLKNYQTKVKALSEHNMKEVLEKGIDIFFDVERFLS